MNQLDVSPRAWCGRVCLVFFVIGWLVAGFPNQWISPPSLFVVASLLAFGAGGCADDRWRLRFFSPWPILLLVVSSPLWLLLSAVVQPTSLWNWCGGDRQPAVALRAWGETLPAWFLAWSFGWCLAMRSHPATRARLGRLLAKWAVPLTLAAMAITFLLHVGWGVAGPMIVDQHAYSAPFASAAAQSDAQQYEVGSYVLAETGSMPEWNQRRPINTAWTVVRMGVSGMDPVKAMWLGAMFLGLTGGLLVREVALALGFASGLMVWVFCWGMARFFLATQLSESFGFALGAWGAAWMVRNWSRESAAYGLLGLFVLTLGQAARPGALFVLPLLGLAGAMVWVKRKRQGWQRVYIVVPLVVSAGIVLAGLSLNPVLNQRYGTGTNVTGSNFALTIVGLASGTSWDAVEVEFADELAAMPDEATRSRWLYRVGWQRFVQQPSLFFCGVIARRSIARKFTRSIEKYLLMLFPRYAIFKEQLSGNIGCQHYKTRLTPVLVQFHDYQRVAFEVERNTPNSPTAASLVTVYLPGSPDPWNGTVVLVKNEQITPLATDFLTACGAFETLGDGMQKLTTPIAAATTADLGNQST